MPDTPGTPIRLTLNHLKRVGDVQNDQTIYNGLFRPAIRPATALTTMSFFWTPTPATWPA